MKRTLHVTPEIGRLSGGGIGSVVTELYKNRKEGDIFLFCDAWYESYSKDEIVTMLPVGVLYTKSERLVKVIDDSKVDTIIFHAMYLFRLYNENSKKKHENVWVTLHNNAIVEGSFLNTVFEEKTAYDLVYSTHKANTISISKYEGYLLSITSNHTPSDKKNRVIYNGHSFSDDFTYSAGKKLTYGYLGRLEERKGIFHTCREFRGSDKKLLLATGESKKSMMTMLAMSVENNANIIPLGFCRGQRFDAFFDEISALIVPSIYEPFGMVFLEAGDKMTSIIANKTESALEILGEDYPLFFDITKAGSLMETLSVFEAMTDDEKKILCARTKNRFIELFSAEKMAENYRSL